MSEKPILKIVKLCDPGIVVTKLERMLKLRKNTIYSIAQLFYLSFKSQELILRESFLFFDNWESQFEIHIL